MIEGLTTEQAMALVAAAGKCGTAKKELAPGTHEITTTVEITATVNKGEDFSQRQMQKLHPVKLAAVLFQKLVELGAVVEIADAVKATLVGGEALEAAAKALKAEGEAAMKVLGGSTLTKCAGKVTVPSVSVKVIEAEVTA